MRRNLTDHTYKKKLPRKNKLYPDSKKLEAVKLWLLTGNLTHTSAALNIPFTTIRDWRYTEWWNSLVQELRAEENIQLSQRLKTIAEKSLLQMEDRLDKGDYILDKQTGQLVRKPVSLRDVVQAYNSVHDRKGRLDDKPKEEADNKQVMDRLASLAAKFEEIALKKQPIQVTDVIYAIHDQREKGLQEGASLGTLEETEPSEGSGSEEYSEETSGA